MNTTPCGKCTNYDPIRSSRSKETRRGWCIVRSKYPHREGPGQVFPPGVARVEEGKLAEPYIVKKDFVHPTCTMVKERR